MRTRRVSTVILMLLLAVSTATTLTAARSSSAPAWLMTSAPSDDTVTFVGGRPQLDGRASVLLDVDRDGDLDLVSSSSDALIAVWINDGVNHFTRDQSARQADGLRSTTPEAFADAASAAATAPPPTVNGATVTFAPNAPQLRYVIAAPAHVPQSVATGVTGRLAWNEDATARVFASASGRIDGIRVAIGERVQAGDVLARLTSADASAAQADVRKADADLAAADRALQRTRDLVQHGAAATRDLEAAEAAMAHAQAEADRAHATARQLGSAGAGVDGRVELRAPISGVVVERNITPGLEVRSDQVGDKPLFVIADPTRLWVYLDVTDADVAEMHAGKALSLHSRAWPDAVFRGRLDLIGDGMDPATRTIKARGSVENPRRELRAEMYVTVDIADGQAAGVEVPASALFLKNGRRSLFVEVAPGRYERREVTAGAERHGQVLITAGVQDGERVVTDGCLLLDAAMDGGQS